MTKPLFRGVCASSSTPFHSDGSVAFQQLPARIDWLIREGADALSPLGSSGEFSSLEVGDRNEARTLWKQLGPRMRLQCSAYHCKGDGAHWLGVMKAALNMIGPSVGDPCRFFHSMHRIEQLSPRVFDLSATPCERRKLR